MPLQYKTLQKYFDQMHPYLDSFWPLDTVFRVIIETSNVYKLYQYIMTINRPAQYSSIQGRISYYLG